MAKGLGCPALLRRNVVLAVGLSAFLGGCTHVPTWVPWYKPPAKPIAKPEPAVPEMPKSASEEHPRKHVTRRSARKAVREPQVAMIDPDSLVGMKPPAVSRMLGQPAAIAKEELSLVWTYRADGCALKVYFYPDIKTSDFHVLKFSLAGADGKTLDDDAPCRRKLLALREHDTG
jgi:hypothetical protein